MGFSKRWIAHIFGLSGIAILLGANFDPISSTLPEELEILCIRHNWPEESNKKGKEILRDLGFPSNHECQSSVAREIFSNEIGLFAPSTGTYKTVYKPEGKRFVGHMNLHWNAEKLLFTQSDETSWKIFEIRIDGTGLRQVSQAPDDVDCFDPCYLPDGRIVFNSSAPYQCVPCWHGTEKKFIANMYIMNPDGTGMRRLTFDQDHDMHPSVRNSGQIIYNRWDYTGINRLFLRPLMTMNPDGTGQRSVYGSNSWIPNGLYYPKELPGQTGKFICVLAGYHGSWRSGVLAVVDLNKGTSEGQGIETIISGKDSPLEFQIMDKLTEAHWPEFTTPSPVTDQIFLASVWNKPDDKKIGIYTAHVNGQVTLVHEEEHVAFLEPIPVMKRRTPPVIPDRLDLESTEATVFIQDIHSGPGLKEVPRGTIKNLRVIAYDFGYIGLAGNDKIGAAGPWDAMRIVGTTPVEEDGSAMFKIPANTPVAFQPLDEQGQAVQLMRTWVTAMPGETMSCVGCHESSQTVALPKRAIASLKTPARLEPWHGPSRGFDFEREVQPVLNRYCIQCHNQDHPLDLRPENQVEGYTGRIPGRFDYTRMHPIHKEAFDNKVLYTPSYESLLPYIRRVNIGDDVSMLVPGEYRANTSELVQLLKEGHKGIRMDEESWSRIFTWIDLNGPCHGTWNDIYNLPIPGLPDQRRWELSQIYGGPAINPEMIPASDPYDETPVTFKEPREKNATKEKSGSKKQKLTHRTIDLGGGEKIEMVNFGQSYWMGTCEISNRQFRLFDRDHSSRYYTKRHDQRGDTKGMPLDSDDQPAIRVSWNNAMEFCEWLSEETGLGVSLPTEEQWEKACRAGSEGAFHFPGTDFSTWENMADYSFATYGYTGKSLLGHFQVAGDCDLIEPEGVALADRRFDDGGCVTMPVGSYKPNAYGLHDMHGNAAEWTRSDFSEGEKTVKGGSYLDRPERCDADQRHGYPAWQSVYNTGFRIVITDGYEESN